MVLANGGAHHSLMNPSEALPACLLDSLVLLTYFYQKCLKKTLSCLCWLCLDTAVFMQKFMIFIGSSCCCRGWWPGHRSLPLWHQHLQVWRRVSQNWGHNNMYMQLQGKNEPALLGYRLHQYGRLNTSKIKLLLFIYLLFVCFIVICIWDLGANQNIKLFIIFHCNNISLYLK